MSLQWVGQDDFSAGTLLGLAQEQQPAVGVEQALNGFFDDDGDIWRRGAVVRDGNAAPAPLTFLWSGFIGNAYMVLVTTASKLYRVSGAALTDLGAAGLAQPILPAIVADRIFLPNGVIYDGAAVSTMTWPVVLPAGARHLAAAANRLVVATGNVVAFSLANAPTTFAASDYHKLPDGVIVQGMIGVRDLLLLFTNYGLWSISGMAFNLTDDLGNPQQSLTRLTPEISLLHEAGLAEWAGTVVAPCVDRCFLIDGLAPPVPISDSISALYMTYARLGYVPGGAKVFRNHYFLPFLNASRVPVALLVCRLNRPVRARQLYYPWAEWGGYPVGISALDVDLRTTSAPVFRGAHKDGYRVDLTGAFPPFAATADDTVSDPDGTHPVFDVQTRDFPTGNGQPNHVRKLRIFYYARGEGLIEGGYSYGAITQLYQDILPRTYAQALTDFGTYDALARGFSVQRPDWNTEERYWTVFDARDIPQPGVEPLLWNFQNAERQRFIRARLRSTDGIGQIKLRTIQFAVRAATHER